MKLKKSPYAFLPALCLFVLTAGAQNPNGKLALQKGQKIQVDNSIKSVINQEMMGQAIEIVVDANLVHKLEVKEKKSNSYLLATTLTKLTTNGSAMGQEMKFDSDKPSDLETETGKALKEQLNVEKQVELDEAATVINAAKKEQTAAAGGQLMDMVNNVTGGINDESNGAKAAFEIIPAGKKAGDSWSDSTISDELKTYRTYTLKNVTGNIATVLLSGKQVTKKKVEQQGMEINVSMDAVLSGEGLVDISTGLLQQRTTVMDGKGSAEVMGQSIPVTTKVTTITTVKSI